MINIQNKVVEDLLRSNKKSDQQVLKLKGILDRKLLANLTHSAIKNNINNTSVLHYLMMPISNSTEAIEGNDYIMPAVKKAVDYVSAAVTKGLSPNGGIKFEFVSQNEDDDVASRQATNMVSYVLNSQLNVHTTIADWVMDGCLNKNGMMLVRPIRELATSYKSIQGTKDQLKAFEQQAIDAGSSVMLKSRRKIGVDLETVRKEMAELSQAGEQDLNDRMLDNHMSNIVDEDGVGPEEIDEDHKSPEGIVFGNLSEQEEATRESLARNTIYEAKYKLTGYNLTIKLQPIKQHYWFCDSRVNNVQGQSFCGFYEKMTVQEACEQYPGIDIEEFTTHATQASIGVERTTGGSNDLSVHARDSVPYASNSISEGSNLDPQSRFIGVSTIWFRHDVDGDDEMELIEIIYSGGYIISAKEVEFIPVANICPRRIPTDFYGMSIAESVIPQQEYGTGASRAEIGMAYQMATSRLGVNATNVDFEMLQDGANGLFLLQDGFDPSKDIFPIPGPSGNLTYLAEAKNSIQQDTMAVTGMVTPNDTFNPEVMADGNSGIKLQLALTPNQIILDNTVKNCAEGVKEVIYLTWRTLIQYSDDFGVKRLARQFHPQKEPTFLDGVNWDDMNFYERKEIQMELALGLLSAENSMSRLEIIKGTQAQCWNGLKQLVQEGYYTDDLFMKLRKPHEMVLYELSVKDTDTILPTLKNAQELLQKVQEAAQNAGQDPKALETQSKIQLNQAKSFKLQQEASTEQDKLALEAIALKSGKATNY